jgi:hypothetical protein
MIDISQEELLSLTDAAERLPPRRNGSRPHASTLFRWAKNGLKDVRLEVLRVGDTTFTSMPALQRFFDRLTEASLPGNQVKIPPSQRLKEVNQALDDFGV